MFTVYSRTVPYCRNVAALDGLAGNLSFKLFIPIALTRESIIVVALEIPRQHLLEAWRTMHLDLL